MPTTLRLLTFNIAHGRGLSFYQGFHGEKKLRKNLEKIAQVVKTSRADIVALQEVDQDSHWNKHLDLLEIIQGHSGHMHQLYGINTTRTGKKQLSYGNGVLSRYPVHEWANNPFGQATLGEKGFLYAEIDVGNHHLPLINLHLDFRSRKRRIEQVEKIIAFITDRPHPGGNGQRLAPIICGDFNSGSERVDDAVTHLFHFVKGHGDYHLYPQGARTFPSHMPSKTIDFVLLPAPYKKTHTEVLRTYASDHRPVLVEFTFG